MNSSSTTKRVKVEDQNKKKSLQKAQESFSQNSKLSQTTLNFNFNENFQSATIKVGHDSSSSNQKETNLGPPKDNSKR